MAQSQNDDDTFYNSVDKATLEYDPTAPSVDDSEQAMREERMREELSKLEEEIGTLKSVLNTKVNQATELKRKMGITTMVEFKEDIKHGFQALKESETVQKTNEKLHQLGESIAASDTYQKTNTAIKSFSAFASKKMGDLKNSTTFKSVEERMGGAYSSIKMPSWNIHPFGIPRDPSKRAIGSQSEESVDPSSK